MKKIIWVLILSILLLSCWEAVLEWKFNDLPESTQKEISGKYIEMVVTFKSNEAKKLEWFPSMDDMERIDNATVEQFNKFKELYKNIDFSSSSFFGMCSSSSTEGACY